MLLIAFLAKISPSFSLEVAKDAGNDIFLSQRCNLLPCLCLSTGVTPAVVAAQAAREVAVRADGNKSYLGLSDVSELSLVCVLGAGDKKDNVRAQFGAQELQLYWITALDGPLGA